MADTKEEEPHVTFQDLPAEIRKQIYGYVLTEPTDIAICIFNPKTDERRAAHPKTTGPRLIRDNDRSKYHRGETYDRKRKRWVLLPPLRTAHLHVNKQIHAEATQVLLGTNLFTFRNNAALDQCLDLLGPRAQHLRYVDIGGMGYNRNYAKETFIKLGNSAPFLKKLYIDHYDICQSVRYHTLEGSFMIGFVIVEDCKEMVKSLEKSYEAGGITFNALEIVDFYLQPCKDWPENCPRPNGGPHERAMTVASAHPRATCGCMCGQAEQQNGKMRQELRRRMGQAWGIEAEDGEGEKQ